jgi:hypothetical protein
MKKKNWLAPLDRNGCLLNYADHQYSTSRSSLTWVSAETEFDLDSLRNQYEEKFNKEAPIRFKNDAEWLKSKLSE